MDKKFFKQDFIQKYFLYCNSFSAPENLIQKGGIKLKNGKGIVKIELNINNKEDK